MADPNRPAGSPDAASSGARMEHDLRAIRDAYDVSLETVEHETRMPPDILRRFEAGQLVGDANYNEVYLRNLLRSYAKALGISHQEVEKAYEATKAGAYDGGLRRLYLEGDDPATVEPPRPAEGTAPAVAALGAKGAAAKKKAEAAPARPNEHFPKERVKSAKASAVVQPIEKSWGMVIAGTVVGVIAIGAVLWFLFRDPSPEAEPVEAPVAADTASAVPAADTAEAAPLPPSDVPPAPRLSTPIAVTVVAEGGPLQGFRVTEAPDVRRPYWLEQGQEQTFQSEEEVVLWGQGEDPEGLSSAVRLRMQGFTWDPPDGQVLRIDPARGQALLDSLHRAQYLAGGAR